jgi:hypothetical protein
MAKQVGVSTKKFSLLCKDKKEKPSNTHNNSIKYAHYANAIKRKNTISLKTGKKPTWTSKAKPYQIKQVLLAIEKVEVHHGF